RPEDEPVEELGPGEVGDLLARLHADFDARADHLPSRPELGELVAAGRALATRTAGEPTGYLVWELAGRRATLKYWRNAPPGRREDLMRLLHGFYIRASDAGATSFQ